MTSSNYRLTRRDFLKIGSASAAGLFLTACGPKDILTLTPTTSTANLTPTAACATPTPPNSTILQPKVISSSSDKLLDTELVVKMKKHFLPGTPCETVELRTYGSPKEGISDPNPDRDEDWDWAFPGPTFRIKPLDTVKIKLYNRLDPIEQGDGMCDPVTNPIIKTATPAPAGTATPTPVPVPTAFPTETYPECFHGNNVTNLHFHGFHVDQGPRRLDVDFSPTDESYGDDVLLAVYPKGQEHIHHEAGIRTEIGEVQFEFFVPEGQVPGTHWYHPHSHGSTHLQVTNGLSGMFIVEDTLDDEFADGAKPVEYVLVIQDIAPLVNFRGGGNNPITLINGQLQPNIVMKPGEIQRWRLVNATGKGSNIYNISFAETPLEEPDIFLISADGVFLEGEEWKKSVNNIYMAPGNRIDVLVKAPLNPGTFPFGAESLQIEKTGDGSGRTPTPKPVDAPSIVPLATITVSGTPTKMDLPAKLPALIPALRLIPDSDIAKYDTVAFSVKPGTSKTNAPLFLIDGKSFDPCDVGHCMVLNTAEEWTITNSTNVAHPFHIHLNPFFITEFHDPNKGLPDPGRRWQDTIIIPPALLDAKKNVVLNEDGSPKELGKVVIRHRFPDIDDKFVIHCHILGHEDRGMMQLVEVVKDKKDCTAPVCK